MDKKLVEICSSYLRENAPSQTSSDFQVAKFVMLCGKYREENANDNRALTDNVLKQNRNDVFTIYSEDLFSIIEQEDEMDLLKFEELLVEISDGIILFLESMGSATELGSFAYLDGLAKKMLVFIDKKYERNESFINDGPVKKINRETKGLNNLGGIIFTPFNHQGNIDLTDKNYNRISYFVNDKKLSLGQQSIKIEENIISIKPQLFLYYLIDLIYIFEVIEKDKIFMFLSLLLSKNKSSKYKFNFKFETENSFKDDVIKEYILSMLIKWDIIKEVESVKDNSKFLTINFSNLFVKDNISKSFGKLMVRESLYKNKEFIRARTNRRREIENKHGSVYDKRFTSKDEDKKVGDE